MKKEPIVDVKDFVNNIKDNPKEVIAWAESEIKLYQELIRLLKNEKRNIKRFD